jgi:transcriptional regulator with XRE-family HTH domain
MKISNAKEFGEEIRRRRKSLNYTQQFLSDFTGFSVSFISDLENGKVTAELGKALYIANILGLDIELKERN